MKWDGSRWVQAGIALTVAIPVSVSVFVRVYNAHAAMYARDSPLDGQNGMNALLDAVRAGGLTGVGVFAALFLLLAVVAAVWRRKDAGEVGTGSA